MKEKIISSYSINLESFYLLEITIKPNLQKKRKTLYFVKHIYFDESFKPARLILDNCDSYIDALYHFKSLIYDAMKIELVDNIFTK